MPSQKRENRATTIIIVVGISALVVMGLGIYYVIYLGDSVTYPYGQGLVIDHNNLAGLELIGQINFLSALSGVINVTLEVRNTENSFNNVTSEYNFPYFGSGFHFEMGICNFLPMGIVVVKGNYTPQNIILAQPLDVYQPGVYSCPADLIVGSYEFLPLSHSAKMYYSYDNPQYIGMTNLSGSVILSGYYTLNSYYGTNSTFHSFLPGPYTVVGADSWGDYVFLHFYLH